MPCLHLCVRVVDHCNLLGLWHVRHTSASHAVPFCHVAFHCVPLLVSITKYVIVILTMNNVLNRRLTCPNLGWRRVVRHWGPFSVAHGNWIPWLLLWNFGQLVWIYLTVLILLANLQLLLNCGIWSDWLLGLMYWLSCSG